jgi:tryptophan synthase alpha chain
VSAGESRPAGAGAGPGAGESRLTHAFRSAGRPLLIPYAVGGYPDEAGCRRILRTYAEAGAGIIEIGVPFSDPLADGPVIQAASQAALRGGIRPAAVLALAGEAAGYGVPIVLLTYLNTILAYGGERFFAACAANGVAGVVVPDVPVEEAGDLQRLAGGQGVDVILLVAPTSTEARLKRITAAASGFIYCVSTTGVTGARAELRTDLPDFIARVRRYTSLPLAVGFGVSTAGQARAVAGYADGVIVGSALVDIIAKAGSMERGLTSLRSFVEEVAAAL